MCCCDQVQHNLQRQAELFLQSVVRPLGKHVRWVVDRHEAGGHGGAGLGPVAVHRAVILPPCPLLSIMEKDVIKEDLTFILPDHPLEFLGAFVKLVYKGSAATSEIVTIGNLLELMASLGLNMPVDRLMIVREEVNEIEIVGFKKRNGLEIIEVNDNWSECR